MIQCLIKNSDEETLELLFEDKFIEKSYWFLSLNQDPLLIKEALHCILLLLESEYSGEMNKWALKLQEEGIDRLI